MPELDGLGVLRQLRQQRQRRQRDRASARFTDAARRSRPRRCGSARSTSCSSRTGQHSTKIASGCAADLAAEDPPARRSGGSDGSTRVTPRGESTGSIQPAHVLSSARHFPQRPPEIVAIGISTGGPAALHEMLPKLPADLPVPVVIVQHMPPKFTRSLADDLDRHCALHVQEASDGERLQPGTVYIAPGGRQMQVERLTRRPQSRITDDPPEKCCKPSVDYLFRSLAEQLGASVLAVIMTGMGDDGAVGCRLLKQRGAQVARARRGQLRRLRHAATGHRDRPGRRGPPARRELREAIEQAVRRGAVAC